MSLDLFVYSAQCVQERFRGLFVVTLDPIPCCQRLAEHYVKSEFVFVCLCELAATTNGRFPWLDGIERRIEFFYSAFCTQQSLSYG